MSASFRRDFWWAITKPCAPIFWPFNPNQDRFRWAKEHMAAAQNPRGSECGIVALINAWVKFAVSNEIGPRAAVAVTRVENAGGDTQLVARVQVSDVGTIGKAWAQVGRQILVLLHGDIGRLDGGTLDRNVKAFARERGVEL